VIDFIMDLIDNGFDIIPLRGNHEEMLLEAYTDPGMVYLWYMNSGETTLQSIGIENIRDIGNRYLTFFRGLKFYESIGNFYLFHAGFNDHDTDPFADTYHMIWESRPSYANPVLKGKIIIHGHRPKSLSS